MKETTLFAILTLAAVSGCSEPRPQSAFKQLIKECKKVVEGTANELNFEHMISPKTNAPFRSRVSDGQHHNYYQDLNLNGVADEKDFYLCTEYRMDGSGITCDDGISECVGTNCGSCYKVLGFTHYPDSVTTDYPIPTITGEELHSRTYSSDKMKYIPEGVLSQEKVVECRKQCIGYLNQSEFITLSPKIEQEWKNIKTLEELK